MIAYSRRWLSLKNDLPEVRNISAKSTSRTCVPAYLANLSIRYFSGSRSRSARWSAATSAVSSADRLIRTPGASWYESAASNSPSTVSISWPCRSFVVAATDSSEPVTATACQSAMATIRATACVDRFIAERRISIYRCVNFVAVIAVKRAWIVLVRPRMSSYRRLRRLLDDVCWSQKWSMERKMKPTTLHNRNKRIKFFHFLIIMNNIMKNTRARRNSFIFQWSRFLISFTTIYRFKVVGAVVIGSLRRIKISIRTF